MKGMNVQMKIQFLNGGLANQAFQYIFAKYYELSHPGDIMYLDDSYFALNTVHNGYELGNVFGITPSFLSQCFDEDVWNYILEQKILGKSVPQILCENGIDVYMISEVGDNYKNFNPFNGKVIPVPTNQYDPVILGAPGDVYYHGYWINKNWMYKYKNHFLKEFTFPAITDNKNKMYMERILNSNSLSIHIRRGDYVHLGFALNINYYKNIINHFKEKIKLMTDIENNIKNWDAFIFSDDIEWCKQNWKELGLDTFGEIIYVEGNIKGKNYIDMQLMSQCKGMVMSNSAFCYLAALLNTRRKIIINGTNREV